MRLYVVNDLEQNEIARIQSALKDRGMAASMEGLFWLEMPHDLLTDEQREHLDDCGPYCLGLEIIDSYAQDSRVPGSQGQMLALELLVRARSTLRCSCIGYATSEQRIHGIEFVNELLRELDILA